MLVVKNLPASVGDIRDIGSIPVSLEEGMVSHSSVLAWRTPWTEEPGGLQSLGSQRVGQDSATNTFHFKFNLLPI